MSRVMGFIDPMTSGDVTVRLQMDKTVNSGSDNVTIDAYIGLPDLKIGQYLISFIGSIFILKYV